MTGRRFLAAVAGGILCALAAAPAWAAETTEVIEGEYVRLVSVTDWEQATEMAPGETMQWDIEVSADAPAPGTLTIAVSATGETPLVVDATLCLDAWRGDECPDGLETLRTGWDVPRDGGQVTLREVDATDVAHLRLDVALGSADAGNATEMRVHVIGAGEQVDAGPELPPTGRSSTDTWILAAGAMLLAGTAALLAARARGRSTGDRS